MAKRLALVVWWWFGRGDEQWRVSTSTSYPFLCAWPGRTHQSQHNNGWQRFSAVRKEIIIEKPEKSRRNPEAWIPEAHGADYVFMILICAVECVPGSEINDLFLHYFFSCFSRLVEKGRLTTKAFISLAVTIRRRIGEVIDVLRNGVVSTLTGRIYIF